MGQNANQNPNQFKALLEMWDVLMLYRWRFILCSFGVTAAVIFASLLIPRKYQAHATFERRTDQILAEIMQRVAPPNLPNTRQSITEQLAGRPAIDQMIDSVLPLAAAQRAAGSDQIVGETLRRELSRKVDVNFDISTPVLDRVRVSYTGTDPQLARQIVNTLVEQYISRARPLIEGRLHQSAQFFGGEVNRHRSHIEDLENQKLAFEIEHADLLPNNPNSIPTILADAQSRLSLAQHEREATLLQLEALTERLKQTDVNQPSTVASRNPELESLSKQRAELGAQLATYVDERKMTERHPDLLTLREQITEIDKRIADTDEQVVTEHHMTSNPKYAELQVQMAKTRAHSEALATQCGTLQKRIEQLNAKSANLFPIRSEYSKLTREVGRVNRQLGFWEDNLRRINLALTAETGNRGTQLAFLQPCGPIYKPISPAFVQVMMTAAALGLMAGSIAVFFAHRTDESFSDGEQAAETLGMPLFGSISEIISAQQRRMRRLRNAVLLPLNTVVLGAVLTALTTVLYLTLEKPYLFQSLTEGSESVEATQRPGSESNAPIRK